ncbi:MAG: IS481 family transposase [Chloroflexota bacterium]
MHPNTKLASYTRERMVKEHCEGEPVSILSRRYGISRTIFYRWWKRYLSQGKEGLENRTSRPHKVRYRLTEREVDQLVEWRLEKRLGPARLAPMLSAPSSTIYRCLLRHGMGRLPRPPRPIVVRYEAKAPGELIHLDVLHLFALKGQKPVYQFTVVDDYTRLAYALIVPRRTTAAALEAVKEAQISFGFPIKRVLTDNDVTFAWTFRPNWRNPQNAGGMTRFTATLKAWGIRHSLTRIRRPQTNGKVERFHRTIREELYRSATLSTSARRRG